MPSAALILALLAFTASGAGAAAFEPFAFDGAVIAAPTAASRYVVTKNGEI